MQADSLPTEPQGKPRVMVIEAYLKSSLIILSKLLLKGFVESAQILTQKGGGRMEINYNSHEATDLDMCWLIPIITILDICCWLLIFLKHVFNQIMSSLLQNSGLTEKSRENQ